MSTCGLFQTTSRQQIRFNDNCLTWGFPNITKSNVPWGFKPSNEGAGGCEIHVSTMKSDRDWPSLTNTRNNTRMKESSFKSTIGRSKLGSYLHVSGLVKFNSLHLPVCGHSTLNLIFPYVWVNFTIYVWDTLNPYPANTESD